MARSIDDIYSAIVSLSADIADLDADDPERARLERERERIRTEAAAISTVGRNPKSIELEIEAIEQRLADIDALQIKEGYMEKRAGKNIQDPGAYSISINRLLTQHHAEEVRTLEAQLARLRNPHDDDGKSPQEAR